MVHGVRGHPWHGCLYPLQPGWVKAGEESLKFGTPGQHLIHVIGRGDTVRVQPPVGTPPPSFVFTLVIVVVVRVVRVRSVPLRGSRCWASEWVLPWSLWHCMSPVHNVEWFTGTRVNHLVRSRRLRCRCWRGCCRPGCCRVGCSQCRTEGEDVITRRWQGGESS